MSGAAAAEILRAVGANDSGENAETTNPPNRGNGRGARRVRLIELADLLPTVHRTLNSTITMLYAAERKHEPNTTPIPRFAPKP